MIELLLDQLYSPGGPVLVALFLISIGAGTVSIFKVIQFMRMGVGRSRHADLALTLWADGNHSSALQEVRREISPTSIAIHSAMASLIQFPGDRDRAREVAAHAALAQINTLSKNLRFLETVAQAAPMLGLLGTVVGMISAFGVLSAEGGAIDPSSLAGGIWVALTATAVGLAVAIPVYFLSMWFEARVDHERATMEAAIARLLFSTAPAAYAESAAMRPPYAQRPGEAPFVLGG